ncbi:MAG: ABC transporter ATP-binding protein, partial [Ilumatobacteraceae bacterium]|nr:ABC transporter ATP-binding protein [Ilumatobacteraceae bacterium]
AVVSSVDETLSAGEWLCLIGPNGAGKSSLLRALAGLVDFSGSVQLGGSEICGLSARELARQVAFVPQDPVLPDDMSVTDYVMLGRNPYISTFGRESAHDRDVVAGLITELSLAVYARRMLGTLSGGERQRVVIARALAQEAPVLLLDEPTSALDLGHQQHALELVDRLRRAKNLIVVSAMHDLTLAGLYSDRLLLLHQGVGVARGSAREVLRSETLAEFYGVSARVIHEQDGTVVVVPQRSHGEI